MILRAAGARRVYLFGSAADDRAPGQREPADIDLAVEGLPRHALYAAIGELLCELEMSVDVIDLDRPTPFVHRLRDSGRLRLVA